MAMLLLGLGALTLAEYVALTRTTRGWFERDLQLRAQLAVDAARESLVSAIASDPARVLRTLADITRDERIMGAAACTAGGGEVAHTDAFPRDLSCEALGPRLADRADAAPWSSVADLDSGPVHVSAIGLGPSAGDARVLLVHDLGFIQRREKTARNLMLASFFVLALGASGVTIIAARIAWRGWTFELRQALRGKATRSFQPLLRDVHALVERLSREREHDELRVGPWTADRLRRTLAEHLPGERVIIVSNREPYIHERALEGVRVQHPASGLVSALEPVMRACSGVWIAHGSGSADRETADGEGRVWVPPDEESYLLRRVWLTEEEESGYYYGFSNEGLWPLCHVAHARPIFRATDWQEYVRVNQRFADAVCSEAEGDDPLVLVQDYHFALAPRMIRDRLPRATIITFWHIPWPNAERFGICPWREQLISGLLGSSIVGFHTQQHCNNFIDAVDAFMESRIDRELRAVIQGRRRTLVRPYPVSIEWPVRWLSGCPSIEACRTSVRRELGLPADALLGVGVDRLDYTKGIEERLLAVDELLARHPELRGRFSFVQLAAPSRTKIDRYRELNDNVEALADRINARWSHGSYRPVILLRAHHEPPTVFRYYRAAEVCYVSSLHDGMNLVAKEFVAARDDEAGVLVLSQFTGAARELTEALVVNPYDTCGAADALAAALHMSRGEQRERMRLMRRLVAELNVYRWAGKMLIDAAELRRRERVLGTFGATLLEPTASVA